MSCCSNCGGCGCSSCNYIVNLPDNPTDEYTAANIGVGGVGVYESQSGFQFGFRNVNSANAMLTVTLDAGNAVVLLTIDAAAIAAAFPAATTAQAGILETATDAEAVAKTAADKILTPSNLAAIGSSTTFAGLVELATNAETQAGVSATLAVTPAGLASVITTLEQTVTWADSVARAALAPTFEGQYGYQTDSNQPYVGTGVGAGDWSLVFVVGNTQLVDENTEFNIDGVGLGFSGTGALNITVATTNFTDAVNFDGVSTYNNSSTLNVEGTLTVVGATISPAVNSAVLVTDGASVVAWQLINTFISSTNTQTGYTNFTNPAVLRTCDTATVTLPQLAQIVGTLINDLKAIKLPAT